MPGPGQPECGTDFLAPVSQEDIDAAAATVVDLHSRSQAEAIVSDLPAKHQMVARMKVAGFTNVIIAKETGLHVNTVALTLRREEISHAIAALTASRVSIMAESADQYIAGLTEIRNELGLGKIRDLLGAKDEKVQIRAWGEIHDRTGVSSTREVKVTDTRDEDTMRELEAFVGKVKSGEIEVRKSQTVDVEFTEIPDDA